MGYAAQIEEDKAVVLLRTVAARRAEIKQFWLTSWYSVKRLLRYETKPLQNVLTDNEDNQNNGCPASRKVGRYDYGRGEIIVRNESEMLNIIIDTAQSDDRVFAAYLNGSRANPNAPKDRYQDFDVMYVVRETESFRKDTSWMTKFGKIVLQQEQNEAFGYGERFGIQTKYEETYSWLLLFEDGNRIDIGVELLDVMKQGRNRNRLFVPLLDKIGCLPQLPPPTDADFYIRKPSDTKFYGCCKEFFGAYVMWQRG